MCFQSSTTSVGPCLEIARYGEQDRSSERGVDRCLWGLRQMERCSRQDAAIALGRVEDGKGGQERGERVEAKSFTRIATQKGGERARASAAGTEDMEVVMDGTLWIEAVDPRGEA